MLIIIVLKPGSFHQEALVLSGFVSFVVTASTPNSLLHVAYDAPDMVIRLLSQVWERAVSPSAIDNTYFMLFINCMHITRERPSSTPRVSGSSDMHLTVSLS